MTSSCHRQLPRRTRNSKDEQNPVPPPLGGGVNSFLGEKPNSPPCAAVCGFDSQVGKRHQRSSKPALLGPCEPVVNESRTAANLDERKPVPPRRRENKRAKERQKRKSRPRRACKGRSHNPNMKQRREGVKKEQVKE